MKWYQRPVIIVLFLVFFFPVGLFLMWRYTNWNKVVKGVVSAVLGLFFISTVTAKPIEAESIEISIQDPQERYSVNSEIPVKVTIFPDGASTLELEYVADEGVSVNGENIVTGTEEGTYELYAKIGEIKSNTLTITVIDFEAELARLEAEAKEAEEKRLAEEAAAKEAEEKRLAEEAAAKEAEEKRLAEEAAAKEAEEKRLAEEAAAKVTTKEAVSAAGAAAAVMAGVGEDFGAAGEAASEANAETRNSGGGTGDGNGENFNIYNNAQQQQTEAQYVLNTSTKRFHHPSCKSVKKIAPHNYATSNSSRDELISQGYKSCGNCKP